MFDRWFGFSGEVWQKEGDFCVKLPPEIKANCDYFVKFKKGSNQLCIFKRHHRIFGAEFQISYTTLTEDQIKKALSLTVFNPVNGKIVKAGINPYHSGGAGSPTDGIETIFFSKSEHLKIALDFIDFVNPLNEIKQEVYAYFGLDPVQDERLKNLQFANL